MLRLVGDENEILAGKGDAASMRVLNTNQPRVRFMDNLKREMLVMLRNYREYLRSSALASTPEAWKKNLIHQEINVMEVTMGMFAYVFGYLKHFDDTLPLDNDANYYMEREWRVLGCVSFQIADIARVLVPSEFVERFSQDVPGFQGLIEKL